MSREVHSLDLWTGHMAWLRNGGNRKATKNKLPGCSRAAFGDPKPQVVQGRPLFAPVGESAREATIKAERGGTEGSSRLELWETKSEVPTQSRGQTAQLSDVRGDGCHSFELRDGFVFLPTD